MPAFIDLKGQVFGRLTVIERAPNAACGRSKWLCKCSCGNMTEVQSNDLRGGKVLSCGCYSRDLLLERRRTHGESKTRLYIIWKNMRKRCHNKNDTAYPRYGGRGIDVCKEWDSYVSFKNWAHNSGYDDTLTLDRIDNDKGYSPQNCRWATYFEQRKNQRNTKLYHGKMLSEISRDLGLSYSALKERLKRGWSIERAISEPLRKKAYD